MPTSNFDQTLSAIELLQNLARFDASWNNPIENKRTRHCQICTSDLYHHSETSKKEAIAAFIALATSIALTGCSTKEADPDIGGHWPNNVAEISANHAEPKTEIVYVIQDIPRGKTILPEALEVRAVSLKIARRDWLDDLSLAVGEVAKHDIKAGRPLSVTDLDLTAQPPPILTVQAHKNASKTSYRPKMQ